MTGADSPLSPDLKARVLAAAAKTASPPRSVARWWRAGMLIGAFLLAVVPYAVFDHFHWIDPHLTPKDIQHGMTREVPQGLLEWVTAGSFLVAMVVVWAALSRGRSMLGRPATFLAVTIVATPVVLFSWRYGISTAYNWTFTWYGRSLVGWRCLVESLAIALAPMAAFLTLRQGSDPNHPAATGALMGVSAGACSWVLVDQQCPVGAPLHLLFGHVLPIVILGAVGALLGHWLLAVRPVKS